MSFSSKVKREISTVDVKRDCNLSLLLSLLNSNAEYSNNTIAIYSNRQLFNLLHDLLLVLFEYDLKQEYGLKQENNLKQVTNNRNDFIVQINDAKLVKNILSSTGFNEEKKINQLIVKNTCCKKAYIKGAFLTNGSVSDPNKAYHLEFSMHNEELSLQMINQINDFGLNSKSIMRKSNYVVYLKESDQIADLLNIIGAHKNLLEFENVRVLKDIRNNVNRRVNFESDNIRKTISAAKTQTEKILHIKNTKGLSYLSNELRELAEIRLEHNDYSLKEIGELFNPKLSKSCVNHRLRKICSISDNIRGGIT